MSHVNIVLFIFYEINFQFNDFNNSIPKLPSYAVTKKTLLNSGVRILRHVPHSSLPQVYLMMSNIKYQEILCIYCFYQICGAAPVLVFYTVNRLYSITTTINCSFWFSLEDINGEVADIAATAPHHHLLQFSHTLSAGDLKKLTEWFLKSASLELPEPAWTIFNQWHVIETSRRK